MSGQEKARDIWVPQFSHFTDENPKAQRVDVTSLSHMAGERQSRDSAIGKRELESGRSPLGPGLRGPVWVLGSRLAVEADMVCMAGGDVQGLGRSLAPTAASLPALPTRPRGTAHTWPLCPASLPLTKTKESRLQGTGAWHPSAGNARPSPPWSLSARTPLLLGSREPVVGVELRPRLEGAGFSLGRVRQPEIEVGTLRPKPGQGLLSQLPILLVSSLRIPRA